MDKNPFEKVLDQIAEIMQYTYDNAHKPLSADKQTEMEAHLNDLEKQVAEFKKMGEAFVEGSEVDTYVFQTMMEDDSGEALTREEQAMLKQAEELKMEAQLASKDVLKAAEEARSTGKRLTGKKKKSEKAKSPQARKGKFKGQGGYKNWTPL